MKTPEEQSSFDTVVKNLNKEIKKIEGKTMVGLIAGVAFLIKDMYETQPYIPKEFGNLRNSWFTNPIKSENKPIVIMGFSANYAAFVHEMVGANFTEPGSGAKWFEAALKRNHNKLLDIVKEHVRVS